MTAIPTKATLTDLLRQAVDDRTGAPLRDIQARVEAEEAARPRGMSLNRSTASLILRGAYRGTPSPATVRAIGWLAGVPDEVAFAAAGQPAPGRPLADELPPAADTLNREERAVVGDVVRALLAHRHDTERWKTAVAEELQHLGDDLERVHDQLNEAVVPVGDDNESLATVTEVLAQLTVRMRRLFDQLIDST